MFRLPLPEPGTNPGGLVTVTASGCGVRFSQHDVTHDTEESTWQRWAVEEFPIVEAHLESCPCGVVLHVVVDGDTGEPLHVHYLTSEGGAGHVPLLPGFSDN
jgi:hypothetical protein